MFLPLLKANFELMAKNGMLKVSDFKQFYYYMTRFRMLTEEERQRELESFIELVKHAMYCSWEDTERALINMINAWKEAEERKKALEAMKKKTKKRDRYVDLGPLLPLLEEDFMTKDVVNVNVPAEEIPNIIKALRLLGIEDPIMVEMEE